MSNPLSLLQDIEAFVSQYGTALIWLVLALPFLAILISIVIPFLVRGFKQGLYQALVSLGSTIVSLVGSVLLSQILAMMSSKLLFGKILGAVTARVPGLSETIAQSLMDGTYLGSLVQWVLSAILATILFVILFIVLLAVCKVLIGKTAKPIIEKMDKPVFSHGGGLLIRVIDALLVAFLFVAPLYSFIGCGMGTFTEVALAVGDSVQQQTAVTTPTVEENSSEDDIMTLPSYPDEDTGVSFSDTVLSITSPFTDCPLIKIAGLPGFNFGERVFGSFMCDGKLYNAYDILDQGSDVLVISLRLSGNKAEGLGQNEVDVLKDVLETANKNDFFYGIFSDALHISTDILDEMLAKEQAAGKDTAKLELAVTILAPFENCTATDIKDCANTIVALFESAVKNDLMSKAGKNEELFEAMSDGPFIEEAVVLLRENKLLSKTVDNLLLISLNYINFSSEAEDNAQFTQTIEHLKDRIQQNINEGTIDPEKEIYAFKTMFGGFADLYASTDGFKTFSFESISSKGIADLLAGLGSHPHIGKQGAEDLINTALPSFGAAATILTDDFIKAATNALVSDIENPPAKGAQGKFENLIATAQNLTNAITNGFGEGKDKEKLNSTVDMLLSDMTPESAEAVTTVLTKDVMDSLNKNGSTTGSTEGFVKDLITNMASYDAPDKASLEKEREAIIKMNDLVLDAENKLSNKPEGQTSIEAAVGGDLKGFVQDVSSSVVLMETVNDTFESNPEKETDPTGMFSSMGQQDKEKLNSVCQEMLQDGSVSDAQKENIKKLCLFMGGSVK